MTDTTRNLIIKLSSHMAYMQGQLEARHELDDLEDYYWYRESVALRQQVADALAADELAAPTERQLLQLAAEFWPEGCEPAQATRFARAALARWGRQPAPPAEGEVAELVALIRQIALAWEPDACLLGNMTAGQLARAADLLERQAALVPVSERLPGTEDCMANPRNGEGQWCWGWMQDSSNSPFSGRWRMVPRAFIVDEATHWLPAHALPLPAGEVE